MMQETEDNSRNQVLQQTNGYGIQHMKRKVTISSIFFFLPSCWATPRRPTSLAAVQRQNQRMSLETPTKISVFFWIGISYTSKKKGSWSNNSPCVQQTTVRTWQQSSLVGGEGGDSSQGQLTLGWLISYQGNEQLGRGKPIGSYCSSPMIKRV